MEPSLPSSPESSSPILKLSTKSTNKDDHLPSWFKEASTKYDTFCESLSRVKKVQQELSFDLRKFDKKKTLSELPLAKKSSFSSLNYHLILEIIIRTSEKGSYLKTLVRMSKVNKYLNKILETEYIWRYVVEDFLGFQFIQLNEKFVNTQNQKFNFWKEIMHFFWQSFANFKKTMLYYKELKAPSVIEVKSLVLELFNSLKFMMQFSNLRIMRTKETGLLLNLYCSFLEEVKVCFYWKLWF